MPYTSSPQIDLELKPSELPPGCTAPLYGPADGRLVSNGKVLLLRLVRLRAGEFVLYARWDGRNALVLRNGWPQIWKCKPTPQKLCAIAGHFDRDSSWKFASVHVISRPQDGLPIVALNRGLHPFTAHPDDHALADAGLWNLIAIEIELDHNQTELANIINGLNTPDSFANFSWRWLRATLAERDELWSVEIARREQLKQLLTWILRCSSALWQQANGFHIQCDHLNWEENWYYNADSQASSYFQLSTTNERWLKSWSVFLASRFQPLHVIRLQPYVTSNPDYALPYRSSLVSEPTAHQQLEARLNLRDWLQKNAPERLDELSPA